MATTRSIRSPPPRPSHAFRTVTRIGAPVEWTSRRHGSSALKSPPSTDAATHLPVSGPLALPAAGLVGAVAFELPLAVLAFPLLALALLLALLLLPIGFGRTLWHRLGAYRL